MSNIVNQVKAQYEPRIRALNLEIPKQTRIADDAARDFDDSVSAIKRELVNLKFAGTTKSEDARNSELKALLSKIGISWSPSYPPNAMSAGYFNGQLALGTKVRSVADTAVSLQTKKLEAEKKAREISLELAKLQSEFDASLAKASAAEAASAEAEVKVYQGTTVEYQYAAIKDKLAETAKLAETQRLASKKAYDDAKAAADKLEDEADAAAKIRRAEENQNFIYIFVGAIVAAVILFFYLKSN